MAHTRIQPELGLRIDINPDTGHARWYGTRAQLEAEGIVPHDVAWPDTTRDYGRFDIDACWFTLHLVAGQGGTPQPQRLYRIDHYQNTHPDIWRKRQAMRKIQQASEILSVGSSQWCEDWRLCNAARSDKNFQDFKRALLGQKRRGRPTKTTPAISTQGASHV